MEGSVNQGNLSHFILFYLDTEIGVCCISGYTN